MERLVVDQEKCIACGACAATVPVVFELGDEGKAKIKKVNGQTLKKNRAKIEEAIVGCPVQAISLKEK